MVVRHRVAFVFGLVGVLAASGGALGQVGKKKADPQKERNRAQRTAKDAGAPEQVAQPTEPVAARVLTLERSNDWTMNLELRIQPARRMEAVDQQVMVRPGSFKFNSAAVVFPMLMSSAAHRLELEPGNQPRFKGELRFNNVVMDAKPTFTDGYAGGTKLARWVMRDVEGDECVLNLEYRMTCWNTVLDEQLGRTIPWPKGGWPAVAAGVLKPDLFVESDDQGVKDLVKGLLEGHDPRSQPPVVLAKFLAGEVLTMVQPSGDGLDFNHNGSFRGFLLKGAAAMARDPRGSRHDVACLLAAVYRAAGLPARVVIGFDSDDAAPGSGKNPLQHDGASPSNLRSWVEFALVDPFDSKLFWIPVDVVRLREASNRPPPLDSPWKFFGTHSELGGTLPIAFQFHPPTSVTSMSPAFWGWITTPDTVGVQSLRFNAYRTPQRGDEPSRANRPAPAGDR